MSAKFDVDEIASLHGRYLLLLGLLQLGLGQLYEQQGRLRFWLIQDFR